MKLKLLNISEITEIYNTYMVNDFPASELKPLAHITGNIERQICQCVGMYEDDTLTGYAVFIISKDLSYGLLDYFAILKEYRGSGWGHKFFDSIRDFLKEQFPNLRGFFIECEDIAFAESEKDKETRTRRISFYLGCNCHTTDIESSVFGVRYSILLFALDDSIPGTGCPTDATGAELDVVYRTMFKPHHYESMVKIF